MPHHEVFGTLRRNWLAIFLVVLTIVLFLLFSGALAG